MQPTRYITFLLLVFVFCQAALVSNAQLGFSFDIPKPKQYEERQLRSEKSEQKKFTIPRRFIQNTTTHYNYFYNASNKLNEIIARAKEAHTDDFTELLSFYNYDLDVTIQDSVQLDSVIYKATSGIVLHDLRSDWADNLYLLWGAAHYLQKEFDSAYLTFQFINYAFAPKEKDGYYQFIGSRMDGNSAISVSTKEKRSLPRRMLSRPPSRNDAFIWQIRTFLAWEQYPEAASLIATLKADPLFPSRLQNDLEEVQALYFYKQALWDSAAYHLSNALSNATDRQEKARWEYLTGQLYELAGNYASSQRYYEKSIGHTVDPIMAVYARLNSIRVDKTGGENYIEENIRELVKMARHDRYADYRDIIYYMAAQMELERNNIGGAQQLLLKAAKYDNGNVSLRNKAYLKLADLALANHDYRQAANFYDSLRLNDPELKNFEEITKKKQVLGRIAMLSETWERQDSLQRIAAMPEDQRKDFVKKILKDLRRKEGLKDIDTKNGTTTTPTDIFSTQSTKSEWYFYNVALKTKGAADFRAKWGTRPNVDNWRRMQAVSNQKNISRPITTDPTIQNKGPQNNPPEELTFENLYNKLPLTEEQLKVSNDSVQAAMFELGKIYANDIEDCGLVISTFEALKSRYSAFDKMDEVLFHLYYCYNKNGDVAKAAQVKSEMGAKYGSSNFTTIVNTGKDPKSKGNTEATKTYENVYDLFIEGRFDEAVALKHIADSMYGENYWTPQLLYIESVYHVRQREDSSAIAGLRNIQNKYPNTSLAEKATTLIDVLSRRAQIEDELNKYEIRNPQPEEKKSAADTAVARPVMRTDSAIVKKPVTNQIKTDSVGKKMVAPIIPFAFNAGAPHYVMIILNKVDGVFGNEAKNAFTRYNREKFYNKTFDLSLQPLDADNKLLVIQPFENAQAAADYVRQVKAKAASEIIPWLKADKYSFSIISEQNLQLLKSNPDLSAYKIFLDQNLPGKL